MRLRLPTRTAVRRARRGQPATSAAPRSMSASSTKASWPAHQDLGVNVFTNPFDPVDGMDNDGNGYVDDVRGWDFDGKNNTTFDGTQDDHGTHVAGTIGAIGGNADGRRRRELERDDDSREVPRTSWRHHRERGEGGGLSHRSQNSSWLYHCRHQQLVGWRRLLAGTARCDQPRR